MALSDIDRDLMIRTVMAEAGDQPEEGQAAVAHVVLNRLQSGKYGDSVAGVILKPAAFEPWGLRPGSKNDPRRFDPNSQAYKKAAAVVDDVSNGFIDDPTGGATHFLQQDIVKRRRGGSLPPWARGQGMQIGDHTFYSPDNPSWTPPTQVAGTSGQKPDDNATIDVSANERKGAQFDPDKAFSQWEGGATSSAPAAKTAEKFNPDEAFKQWESPASAVSSSPAPQKPTASAQPPAELYPNTKPTGTEGVAGVPLEPALKGSPLDVEARNVAETEAQKKAMGERYSAYLEKQKATQREQEFAPSKAIKETFQQGGSAFSQGAQDFKEGRVATGVGRVGIGGILAAGAPVIGPMGEVTKEVGQGIGNPEAAERASVLVPGSRLGKAAEAVVPANRALKTIADMIPAQEIPETIAALKRNPQLTIADINPSARSAAMHLRVNPESAEAQKVVADFAAGRRASEKVSIQEAAEKLGKLPDPLQALDAIKQKATEVGSKIINPVVQSSKFADVTNVVNFLDKEVAAAGGRPLTPYQNRLAELRDQIRGTWPDRDQMLSTVSGENGLHGLQSSLRAEAQTLLSSATGSDRLLGQKLMDVRNRLVDSIDKASGGQYKPALSKYRDAKQVEEAFDRGLAFERNRAGRSGIEEDSPAAWQKWHANATDEEKAAARIGALSAISDRLKSIRTARQATDIPNVEPSMEKLSMMFGTDKAKQFSNYMIDQRKMAETLRNIEGGSQTAERLLGSNALPVRQPGAHGQGGIGALFPMMLGGAMEIAQPGATAAGAAASAAILGGRAIKRGYEHIRLKSDLATRHEAAKLLTASGEDAAPLIRLLESRLSQGNKTQNALASPIFHMLPR